MTDQELMQKIAAKDQLAFKELVQHHQELVLNVCYHLLGHREDAEDVAQEVFIKAYHSAKDYRGDSRVSTWLYRIAVNLSLNHLRRKKRLHWLSLDFQNKENNPAKTLTLPYREQPDAQLEQEETRKMVMKAIHSLPQNQKTAFVLHKLEGLAYQEIAAILGCSLSSVESRIHRAKVNLQKKLTKYF